MVAAAAAGRSSEAGGTLLTAVAVATAAVAAAAVGLRAGGLRGLTSWMHGLLAVSQRYPLPDGATADVCVVLGYALHRNGTCTRPLQSRVEVAVELFRRGTAGHLIFSGAQPGGGVRNVSEAGAMEAYAEGVLGARPPAGAWLLEDRSTSTRTNALYSLAMIRERQRQRQQAEAGGGGGGPWLLVVLATSPFHQLRSHRVFLRAMREAGMPASQELYVADAPFAGHRGYGPVLDALADQWDFWRELAALVYYWARGWL